MRYIVLWFALISGNVTVLVAQDSSAVSIVADSVTIRFVNTDLAAAIQTLGRYLDKPIIVGTLPSATVTFETPGPVRLATLPALVRGILESHNMEMVEDSAFYRVVGPPDPRQIRNQPRPGQAQPSDVVEVKLHVVHLRHARAADVAATVNQLFGSSGQFATPGLSTGTLSDELRRSRVAPEGAVAPSETAPRGANLIGPVTIVPDELTNTLLVRSGDDDFALLQQAIQEIDVRPLQVMIEVLIVEARSDKSFSLGVDVFLPSTDVDLGKGFEGVVDGVLSGGGVGDLVVRVMQLGKHEIDATLGLASSKGNVRIVSRPVLIASNNTEARLLVGAQRPFVQVSRSLPTDTPSRDQVIQFRDVGTKLTLLPTINQDGYISLVVQQEISAATAETQFDAPVISTREAVTQVLVRDGQTIVIGGLKDQQREQIQSGVPILSSLPVLGGLFGSKSYRTTETELFLFITPVILRTDDDIDRVTTERLGREAR